MGISWDFYGDFMGFKGDIVGISQAINVGCLARFYGDYGA